MQMTILAVLGVAFLFIGWILMIILPGIRTVVWGLLALGAVCIGVTLVVDFRRIGEALMSRRGKFGVGRRAFLHYFLQK